MAPTLRDAQGSIDTQPEFRVLLGPVDNGVIRPEAQPVVRGQGGNVITQEEEDAQEGDDKSQGLHVVPVHGELDLEAAERGISASAPAGPQKSCPSDSRAQRYQGKGQGSDV